MTISTGAAPAVEHAAPRPRLLKRQVSEAQREAARRNGAKSRGPATARGKAESSGNARKHGLYARLHILTPEETHALRLHIQGYLDSPHARNPAAVPILRIMAFAVFQQRRAWGLETALLAEHGLIPTGAALRLWYAIGVFESRYSHLYFRSLDRFTKLISGKQTPESIEKKVIAQIGNLTRLMPNSLSPEPATAHAAGNVAQPGRLTWPWPD